MWKQSLAEKLLVRKTLIPSILKNQDKILHELETNEPFSKQRSACKTGKEEINILTWEWFKDWVKKKLLISGPMLQEKAEFKASIGWLESFCMHNNIAPYIKSGENADAHVAIVEDWKEVLPTLLEGYNPCGIFNMDETGLFFRTNEDKTLHHKDQECSGNKKVNIWWIISLCANMVSDKETS